MASTRGVSKIFEIRRCKKLLQPTPNFPGTLGSECLHGGLGVGAGCRQLLALEPDFHVVPHIPSIFIYLVGI
jgi:hypothetical protein